MTTKSKPIPTIKTEIPLETCGPILLSLARTAITEALGLENAIATDLPDTDIPATDTPTDADWLNTKAACFITLTLHSQLRGCIGSLHARRSLLDEVKANALAAAFEDSRFTPLTADELEQTRIEISLLSALQELVFENQEQALVQLRPDIEGVVLEYKNHRATFLPQVWQQLPQVNDFISHLKQKAGLDVDFWSDEVRLFRYTVSKWQEHDRE